MFHKQQQLTLLDLAEKSSVRPLGVNLDLAKGHGIAQKLSSSAVFVMLAVIYLYHKSLQSHTFLFSASIAPSPLCSSSLILCSVTLGNCIHFFSLIFLLPDGQNPGWGVSAEEERRGDSDGRRYGLADISQALAVQRPVRADW